MKKSLVALLVLAALMSGGVASATAIDFGTYTVGTSLLSQVYAVIGRTTDQNGGVGPGPSLLPNGLNDRAEAHMVIAILQDASHPLHQRVYDAWVANLARVTTDIPIAAYRVGIAMYWTFGDALTQQSMVGWLATLGYNLNPANYNNSCAGLFGPNDDVDGDLFTNLEEYTAAVAPFDLTGGWVDNTERDLRFYTAYTTTAAAALTTAITDLTCTISKTPAQPQIFSGKTVTLSATIAAAEGDVSYQWFKGETAVGTGATLVLANVTTAASGSYTCVATDSATPPNRAESNAVTFEVLDSANLPAMGIAGIALLLGLAGALGVRKIRK